MKLPLSLRKEAVSTFCLALCYGLFLHALQFALFKMDMVKAVPTSQSLLNWDATWYHVIVKDGYWYIDGFSSNSGFFILLPWIWKALHLGAWGISILNIVFFSIGFTILNSLVTVSSADKFLWLTIPSMYFCFIPYTEALFILLMSLTLYAVHSNNRYLLWVSLFLASLTRPVALVMIPACLLMELLTNERKAWIHSLGRFLLHYALPMLIGLAFFISYQHYTTGIWFAYFKQQSEVWGHKFAWPTLPFSTVFGLRLLWLNALAMFIGFLSLLFVLRAGLEWLLKNKIAGDKLLVLSYLYLGGMLLVTILFNPIWGTNTTNVHDLHRYAFASPFFLIFLHQHTVKKSYTVWDFVIIVVLSNVFWLLFASFMHIQYFLYFNINTLLLVLYMLYANKQRSWPLPAVAGFNMFMQITMFQLFIQNVYPG